MFIVPKNIPFNINFKIKIKLIHPFFFNLIRNCKAVQTITINALLMTAWNINTYCLLYYNAELSIFQYRQGLSWSSEEKKTNNIDLNFTAYTESENKE